MENETNQKNELYVNDTGVVDNNPVETTGDAGATVDVDSTEAVEKTYSQQDVDKIIDGRTKSLERKHRKEMESELSQYREMADVIKQGLGVNDISEATNQLKQFYSDQGVDIKPVESKPHFDEDEEKYLARRDAEEVMALGEIEMTRRANELANMQRTAREQEEFMILADTLTRNEAKKELKSKGVDDKVLDSDDFKKFASQFNYNTKLADIYEIYAKANGLRKEQPKVMDSLENNTAAVNTVKDFYTKEEAEKFTVKDFDNNPALWDAVQKSASRWK